MKNVAQQTSIETRFVLVVKHQIKAISTMIDNARDAKLTTVKSDDMDTILRLIETMEKNSKQGMIVEMFIKKSEYWDIIGKKDLKALEKNFPLMFEGLPIDVNNLSEPIRVYFAERSKMTKKAMVISDKSIEAMWINLDKMVKASIIYDNEHGNAFRDVYNLNAYYLKYGIGQ